jgi:hypothetical protein
VPTLRLTYANVVSTAALLVALGGSSYAVAKIDRVEVREGPATTSRANHLVGIGQMPKRPSTCCYVPGAGAVEVRSGNGRVAQLTHYQYGSTIRTLGKSSHIFEFFLGDRGNPGQAILSVRNNGNGSGGAVQARNATDTSSLILDFGDDKRPTLHVEDAGDLAGSVLGIENPHAGGSIAMATKTKGAMTDHVVLDSAGRLRTDGHVNFGNEASDKVVFHGAAVSGAQGADPGALPVSLTAAAMSTPHEVAAVINENRRVINALRAALRAQGLIG